MKINILKTTLATTALFTAISCLVQAPARADEWGWGWSPNGNRYTFKLDTNAQDKEKSLIIGSYIDAISDFSITTADSPPTPQPLLLIKVMQVI